MEDMKLNVNMKDYVLVDKKEKIVHYNCIYNKKDSYVIISVKGDLGTVSNVFSKTMFSNIEELSINERLKYKFESISAFISFKKKLKEMIYGVFNGYMVDMYFKGLGYRGWVVDNCLYINIGYTHIVKFNIPYSVVAKCRKNHLVLFSTDLEKLNDIAANLAKVKIADPYRGKGVRYVDVEFILKVGKTR